MSKEGGPNQEIIIARHLRDSDELLTHQLDNPLVPDQEKKSDLMAEEIIKHCQAAKLDKIVIVSSIRRRAMETTELIQHHLTERASDIKVEVRKESALRELDQGQMVLPEGFEDGDKFQPLLDAWDVFFKEAFSDNNLLYKFGDPVIGPDGKAKYDQLNGRFSSYGECYAEFIMRVYDFLVSMSQELNQAKKVYEPVLVIHGATFSIVRDLAEIGREIDQSIIKNIPFGTLVRRGWDEYQRKKAGQPDPDFGEAEAIDVSSLMKPEIMEIIAIERDRMRANLMQAR